MLQLTLLELLTEDEALAVREDELADAKLFFIDLITFFIIMERLTWLSE